ncbi:MAG: response regulator transcription factor [Acidobacteriaceae bacterium]|nr:response regulator transcription factor [Acidobacteriaceae bacterium]
MSAGSGFAARVLIVDDEPQLRRVMRTALTANGYEPYEARTGEEALEALREFNPDVILLDLNMPGRGGMAACRDIRAVSEVAIIVLSVRDREADKIAALDAGADDYITKPFSVNELMARIRANLRRLPGQGDHAQPIVVSAGLTIDPGARQVIANGQALRLTPKEFDLLQYLLANANKPVAHRKLLQTLWGPDYGDEVEYLRVFVSQLRKKIEPDPAHPRYILTEPWVGYRFAWPEKLENSPV